MTPQTSRLAYGAIIAAAVLWGGSIVAQKLALEPLPPPSAGEERRIVPRLHCFATDSVEKFRRLGERFLGHEVERVTHVNLE